MKHHTQERSLQVALITLFILSLLCLYSLIGIWYYDNIHGAAMASVVSGCHIIPENVTEYNGYVTIGTTRTVFNEETQQEQIEIDLVPEIYNYQNLLLMAVRHELCHADQIESGGIFAPTQCNSTNGKFKRYINEVQCYFLQNFKRNDVNESAIKTGDLSSVVAKLEEARLPSYTLP